jgi:hypothetical protein
LFKIAFGVLNLSEDEFWDMTPQAFSYRTDGYWEHFDLHQKLEWERVRWLGTIILQPHMKKGRTLKPTDLIKFEWEKGQSKKMSKDDIDKRRKHAEFVKKKYSKISRNKNKK